MMKKQIFVRRGPLEIIFKILDSIGGEESGKLSRTHIMYMSNLNWNQLKIYLSYMRDKDLIDKTVYQGKEYYVITYHGVQMLNLLRTINNLLIE